MFRTITASIALITVAAPAVTQEVSYLSFGADWQQLSTENTDIEARSLNGDIEYSYGQFLFGAALNNQNLEILGGDITFTTFSGFVAYAPVPEALVGAGLSRLTIDNGGGDESFDGFELFAQYRMPTFGAGLSYGEPNADDEEFSITSFFAEAEAMPGLTFGAIVDSISDIDLMPYIISVDYADGPIAVRGFYHGITEDEGRYFGVRGSYAVSSELQVTASATDVAEFFIEDATGLALGASYRISDGLLAEASVGRLFSDGEDVNMISIGLTYEIGGSGRLDRALQDAARRDRDVGGISVVLPDYGFGGTGVPLGS